MKKYIPLDDLVAEIERRYETNLIGAHSAFKNGKIEALREVKDFLNTLEVKKVDLMMHTIIAECCDWLAMNTNLSHDKIEGCRNLMLTVKEEQFKAQKGK